MADLNRVRGNVGKMIEQGAPGADIDAYLAAEGVTAGDLKRGGGAPTLDDRAQDVLGLDPTLQRGAIVPLARNKAGELEMAVPQIGVDLLKSAMLPVHAARGGAYTEGDVTKMAMDYGGVPRAGMLPTRRQFIDSAPTSSQLRKKSDALYSEVASKGINAYGPDVSKMITDLGSKLKSEGIDDVLHPKAASMIDKWTARTGNAPDVSLSDLEIMRKQAGIVSGSLDASERRLGVMMKDAIDNYVDSLPDTAGLREARSMWRRRAKVQDIDEVLENAANGSTGLESGIRNGFRAILRNKKRRRGYTPDELSAMKKVVNGGPIQQALRVLRHLGPGTGNEQRFLGTMLGASGGAAAGGPVGAFAVPALGHLAGRGASKMTKNSADYLKALAATGGQNPKLSGLAEYLLRRAPGPVLGSQLPQAGPRGPNGGFMVGGEEVF